MTSLIPWPKAPAISWTTCVTCPPPLKARAFEAELKFKDADTAKKIELLFTKAGATVEAAGNALKVKGDLGQVMFAAIDDSDGCLTTRAIRSRQRYDLDPKAVLRAWWTAFKELDRALKLQQKFREAKVIVGNHDALHRAGL